MDKRICSEPDCGNPHIARGFCHAHYVAARREGLEPLPPVGHVLSNIDREAERADCAQCGPGVEITIRSNGRRVRCAIKHREDLERRAQLRRSESEERKAQRRQYHREYARAAKYQLRREIGLERLLDRAGWCCEICGTALDIRSARVDHDHACCPGTGVGPTCGRCIRGILCNRCNTALGLFKDDADVLLAASIYVTTHSSTLPAA